MFFRTLAGFDAAAIIASAGVTLGLERYLCLKNTFVLIIVALVSFDHTVQHLHCSGDLLMTYPLLHCCVKVFLWLGFSCVSASIPSGTNGTAL